MRYYTIPQLAIVTGLPEGAIRNLSRRNILRPAIYSGTRGYYRIEDLDAVRIETKQVDHASQQDDQQGYERIAANYNHK